MEELSRVVDRWSCIITHDLQPSACSQPEPAPAPVTAVDGNADSGVLSTVDYIQRLHTRGGVAPNGGICDPASDQTVGVPYTAVYRFFSDSQ